MKSLIALVTFAVFSSGGVALADQWGLTPPGGIDSATFGPMTFEFIGCKQIKIQAPMKTANGGAFYYRFKHADGTRTQYQHFSNNGPAIVYAIDTIPLPNAPALLNVEDTLEVYGTIYPDKGVAPFPPSGDPKTWKPVAHRKAMHACTPTPGTVNQPR